MEGGSADVSSEEIRRYVGERKEKLGAHPKSQVYEASKRH